MKHLYLFGILFTVYQLSATAPNSAPSAPIREKVIKYDFELEHTLRLKAKFGQDVFVNSEDIAQLNGLKIHHIDLVYSAFTASSSFDQDKLNLQRIQNLKKALPQIDKDQPTWKYIEQTGPKSLKEAKTYFHGFVLHYGPSLDYQHLKSFFKPFQKPPQTFKVNSQQGGTFNCGDGASVNIGGNTVTHADGSPVNGDYTIEYTEFKNPADILFSGIPMTYNDGQEDLNFSSVGMYDLRAVQNDKPLRLNEPAKVDFNCTKPEKGVAFYQMDDATGQWTKQKDVSYGETNTLKYTRKSELEFDGHNFEFNSKVYETNSVIQFDEPSWDWLIKHLPAYPQLDSIIQKFDETQKTTHTIVEPKALTDIIIEIMIEEKKAEMKRELEKRIALEQKKRAEWEAKERQRRKEEAEKMAKIREENQKYGRAMAEAGISSPSMVTGLSSANFGVYNCDQLYRLEQPLALSPTYVDENGTEITSKHVVCVMDLNFNGSFSFHPNNIKCSGVGKNVILLFTDDKSVFMLSEERFKALDLAGNLRPVFKMKNMTGIIKTSDDLKTYLNI